MKKIIILFLAMPLVLLASPTRSIVAGRSLFECHIGQDAPSYIQDGLFFIGEGMEPPASGPQVIQIGNLSSTDGFTIEICGRCSSTQRSSIMLGETESPYARPFGIGWWLASDNYTINFRWYYNEKSTGITIHDDFQQLSYSLDSDNVIRAYANGLKFLTVGAGGAQIVNPITHLVGGDNSYWDIYSLRVYDRVLSDDEIAFNCSVDEERFGQ